MKKHVLIVDDDRVIQEIVSYLTSQGLNLRTTQVASGVEMNQILKHDQVDLLVLDLSLPDEDGLVLARQVRSRSNLPILVLTGDEKKETLIAALELGVDDFVRKPFDPLELQLRIRNLIRRSSNFRPNTQRPGSSIAKVGTYSMDLEHRTLTSDANLEVNLTYNEFNLLSSLVKAEGRPVSRGTLLDAIAMGDDGPTERAIDVYILQLRKKLEADPGKPKLIKSARGFGYRLSMTN